MARAYNVIGTQDVVKFVSSLVKRLTIHIRCTFDSRQWLRGTSHTMHSADRYRTTAVIALLSSRRAAQGQFFPR